MLVALLTAVVLYFSIQLLQKDRDATDFGTVFIIVFVPALILFISNVIIGTMGLNPLFSFIPMVVSVAVVFFMSNNIFEWGNKKSAALSAIYIVTLIGAQVGLTFLAA